MITPKPSESYTRNDKPNFCVAQIEYMVLNAALEYKILPGGCRNLQFPQFNPPHRQELPMRRKSCDTNICHLEFGRKKDHSPVIKHTAWWIFPSHTLVQLLYNLHCQDVEIQNVTLPQSELNDPINSHHFDQVVHYKEHIHLGAWFLACSSSSPVPNTMSVVSWSLWPGSMLSSRDSCVDMATDGDLDPC